MPPTPPVDPARRALIGVAAAGIIDPSPAAAAPLAALRANWRSREDWLAEDPELAARLRSRLADLRASMESSFLLDRGDEVDAPTRNAAADLREGLAAFELFKEVEAIPVEAQVQPEVQSILVDVLCMIGVALRTASEWLGEWANGAGVARDPDATHLRASLRVMAMSMADGPLDAAQQLRAEVACKDLADGSEGPRLRQRVRRALARYEKARRLAAEMADSDAPTGLMEPEDALVRERVLAVLPPTQGLEPHTGADRNSQVRRFRRRRSLLVLAAILLGVGFIAGLVLIVVGLCGLACEPGVGFALLLLAGVALIGLSIGLGDVVEYAGVDPSALGSPVVQVEARPPEDASLGKRGQVFWVEVPARSGWVLTEIEVRNDHLVHCEAWGTVLGGASWSASPNGDGVAAGATAPLPGAPGRSLIGKVGERVFFIGAGATFPGLLKGPIELGINASTEELGDLRGGFSTRIRVESVP